MATVEEEKSAQMELTIRDPVDRYQRVIVRT
jgi:hypothetical protein